MTIDQAWKILQMEPTDDESAIKKQYKSLLPQHNPEDDPEGFKNLREAYELAVNPPKEEAEPEPDDDIARWLKKVEAVYRDIFLRRDPKQWEKLLSDPLCQGLDTSYETRERLLVFIMSHQYLPKNVWILLNDTFRFVEEKEDLLEKFPENFLDYLIYQVEKETFGDYDLFDKTGEGEPDYDGYINLFYDINREITGLDNDVEQERVEGSKGDMRDGPVVFLTSEQIFEKNEDLQESRTQIHEKFDELHAKGVYHPYEDVEALRLALLEEKTELPDGRRIDVVAAQMRGKYDDAYVLRVCGEALSACDKWEEALECWNRTLELVPDHAMAHFDMARYQQHLGDYEKAENIIRDHIQHLNGSPKVKNFFMTVQCSREAHYLERLKSDPEDLDAWIELCWSRFHSDRIRETLEMLDQKTYTPGTSEYYDYVDMKGRCLLETEDYEGALHYLKEWEKALEELPDDGSDKYKKRKKTLGYQRYVLAQCYGFLAIYRKDPSLYETALDYAQKAIEVEWDESMMLPYRDLMQRLRLRSGKYKEVVDDCDEQIREDRNNLPAYMRRQEAYYRLHDGQGVVDDYHSILALYRDYYRPYLLALRVFMVYKQYEDAQAVIRTAEENKVRHPALALEELRLMHETNLGEKIELFRKKANALLEEVKEADPPKPEAYEDEVVTEDMVGFEIARVLTEEEKYDEALEMVEGYIEKGTKLRNLYMLRANLKRMKKDYAEAITYYKEIAENEPDNPAPLYYLGECYRATEGDDETAISWYKKILEMDPEEDRAVYELARCYQRRYEKYEALKDYEESKRYFDKLVEMNPTPFVMAARADLLTHSGDLDAAIADLQAALDKSEGGEDDAYDDSFRLYRIGDMNYLMRRTDEAERIFRECIDKYGSMQTAPIYQLADTLGSRGRWNEALEVLKKYLEEYKDKGNYINKLAEIYVCCGDEENANKCYDRLHEIEYLNDWQVIDAKFETLMQIRPQDFDKCFKEFDRKMREILGVKWTHLHLLPEMWYNKDRQEEAKKVARYFHVVGDKLLYARKYRKAFDYLIKACALQKDLGQSRIGVFRSLALCCRLADVYLNGGNWKWRAELYAGAEIKECLNAKNPPKHIKEMQGEPMNTEEYYLRSQRADNAIRYERLAMMYLFKGDQKQCLEYLEHIEDGCFCLSCRYQECYDRLIVLGYLAEINGDRAKAREYFERATKINPTDIENTMGLWANSQ